MLILNGNELCLVLIPINGYLKSVLKKCKIDCCIEVGNIKTIEIIKDLNLHQIKWLEFLYSEDDFFASMW